MYSVPLVKGFVNALTGVTTFMIISDNNQTAVSAIQRKVALRRPEILRDAFNVCLKFGLFPHSWKVANLVLLRKGETPLERPFSYRPICLLNTVGKLFEKAIKRLLEKHLEECGELNERKFGFRKASSTVGVVRRVMDVVVAAGSGPWYNRELCVVVPLDVANAFNTAKWGRIEQLMHDKRMPPYLISAI